MKIEQNEGFQPVTITLESRGELAVLFASVGATCWQDRKEIINREFKENLDEKYYQTGRQLYEELKEIFIATKPQTT